MKRVITNMIILTLLLFSLNIITVVAENNGMDTQDNLLLNIEVMEQADPHIPGKLKDTGTYFALFDSEYLNITVDSSEPVTIILESVPDTVTMQLEAVASIVEAEITIGGLEPTSTYHKYEDSYHNHVTFTTDQNGNYIYMQNLSEPHLIFIQPRASTVFLSDSGWSKPVGTWDPATRIATLTQDLNESIQINSNNLTLDGNGYIITGSNTGNGIYMNGRTGVIVKNLTVRSFSYGIHLHNSSGNIIQSNLVEQIAAQGIYLNLSSNNTLNGNTANNNHTGIHLNSNSNGNNLTSNNVKQNLFNGILIQGSSGNSLTGNASSNNGQAATLLSSAYGLYLLDSTGSILRNNEMNNNYLDLRVFSWTGTNYNHDIDTSNLANGKPIYYLKDATGLTLDASTNAATIYLIRCTNITVRDLSFDKQFAGIVMRDSQNCLVENVEVSNSYIGSYQMYSGNTTYINNKMSDGYFGILVTPAIDTTTNILLNNIISNNIDGISLNGRDNNIEGNTIKDNTRGLYLWNIGPNRVKNNIITGNTEYGIFVKWDNLQWDPRISIFERNLISGNGKGVILAERACCITVRENTISNNSDTGLLIDVSSPWWHGAGASNCLIYNNNFIDNTVQAKVVDGINNVFYQELPAGGNYWNDWTTPDDNNDQIVDDPYAFTGGQDNYPWTIPFDFIPPTTSINFAGVIGENEWYRSDVVVQLNAVDGEWGSGVAQTFYRLLESEPWVVYENEFSITEEGYITVFYYSTDKRNNSEEINTATIKIDKTPPVITITTPEEYAVLPVGFALDFSASDALSGLEGEELGELFNGSETMNVKSGDVISTAGVYTLTVRAEDQAGNTAAFVRDFVVYDPEGGFVTGGGWIWSPEGAYAAEPALEGRATFAFVSRYQKGRNIPDGNTRFQFRSASLNFYSTDYEWLVVAGHRAQFKGSGTINGEGDYGFMLTAIDGNLTASQDFDSFRIKIWDKITGSIIYDNQMGKSDSGDDTTELGGGSIVIHSGGKGK